jgi:hypothetical protein
MDGIKFGFDWFKPIHKINTRAIVKYINFKSKEISGILLSFIIKFRLLMINSVANPLIKGKMHQILI